MAHIIEVVRDTASEARSFLDALFYSDSVSAIGHRPDKDKTRAVAAGWEGDEKSELGRSACAQIISEALRSGKDEDVDAHRSVLSNFS